MSQPRTRKLVLNAFFMRFGHHAAAWRHPAHSGTSARPDAEYWIAQAQAAEAAKFHTFFLADFVGRGADNLDEQVRAGHSFQFEPFTLLSAIAARTRRIGLVATVNTNFTHPYTLARQFASFDHLSQGRAAWNVVATLPPQSAKNYGLREIDHGERYEQAAEFIQVAKSLWDSWEDDTFDAPDRRAGAYFDRNKVHPVKHQGAHYQVEGLLDVPRPIQGYPVFFQAGNSDVGREFAAKHAEGIYASATDLDIAQAYYRDVKGRLAKYGRDEDDLLVTPGLSVIVANTDQEAINLRDELHALIDLSKGVNLLGQDLSGYPLDGPLPDLPEGPNGKGRQRQLYDLARKENLTIRELYFRFGISRGHVQAVGSVKTVADIIESWFTGRGADGFNVVPPLLPQGFHDFTRLVVPELQRRGIFQTEYSGNTYRERLGLKTPPNQHRRPLQATAAAGAGSYR
jgi:FMN-dependent oxidoreductase (nitrilotriacetate monooxygenase family)